MAKNTEELRNVCVSDGTMRTEDLFPKMYWILKEYAPEKAKEFAEFAEDDSWMGERAEGARVMGELFYALDEIAPEGCYFGSQEGDGACYGFWEMEEESYKRRGRMLKESYFDCYEYTLEKAKETIKNFDSDAHGFDAIGEPVVFEDGIRQSYISDLISLVYSGNATDEELEQFNSYKEDWKEEYRKYAEEHGLDPEDTSSDVAEEHFDSWMSDVQVECEIVFHWGHDHEEDGDVVGFYIEGEAFNVWLELRDEEKECSKEQIDRFFRIFSNKLANLDRNSGGSPLIDINDLAESHRPSRRGRMLRESRIARRLRDRRRR